MPRIELTPDFLIVRLSVMEKVFCLNGDLHIPVSHVRGATEDDGFHRVNLGIRLPGTDIPGLLKAGTFVSGADKQFVCLKRALQPLVIELAGFKFTRLVVGVPDARADAACINAVIANTINVNGHIEIHDLAENEVSCRRQTWIVSASIVLIVCVAVLYNRYIAGG
jgi:hypothetical protein